MTDASPEKMRVMSLAEEMPALSPEDSICYIVSVGQPAHQGSILLGIIDWLATEAAAHDRKVHVLIADTAQRFNSRIGNDIPEDKAFLAAERNGVGWKMAYTPDFAAAGIVEVEGALPTDLKSPVFLRWEDLRQHPDFQRTHDGFKLLYEIDRKFAKDVDDTKKEFLGRPSRPAMDDDQRGAAAQLVHDFLIEEAAIYTLYARLHPGIAVYPGKALKAFTRPRANRFYTPTSLKFEDLPPSLQADRRPREKANAVLRRAVTGMHQQKFIELKKHSNRKSRKSFPAYSINALQESVQGFYSNLNAHDRVVAESLNSIPDQRALRLVSRDVIETGLEPVQEDYLDYLRRAEEVGPHRPPHDRHDPAAPTTAPACKT